jgi:hypothetical protein
VLLGLLVALLAPNRHTFVTRQVSS